MEALIQVFRMTEVSATQRAKIIIQLGHAINAQFAMNITEGLVYELVSVLDPENDILKDVFYMNKAGVKQKKKKVL